MIRKYRSPNPGHVRVVFELPSSVWADRISLTGDFNDWRENDIVLKQARSGVWQATVDLPLGTRHQFRYVIDGQWSTDSHADGMSDNSYGSQNSVVVATMPDGEQIQQTPALIHDSRPLRTYSPPTSPILPRPRTTAPLAPTGI
jgi:1,4-alpha-glucan branching enzyme